MATTPNYEINYDDKRFQKVESQEKAALNEIDTTYGNAISQVDTIYNDAINKVGVMDKNGNWNEGSMAQIQTDAANERTEFTIQEIEQQKENAEKDYIKEQSGAYVDWQKQSNQYGANAEKMAANGMTNTGYHESSQVSMYNTYQNRVATAREAFVRVIQGYDNAITEARVANNSVLAEIAVDALKQGLELTLDGFQYKNNLIIEQSNKKLETKQFYANQWQNIFNQMNEENKLKENVRQHNENLAETTRHNKANESYQNKSLAETIRSNKADESYKNKALAETIRANKAQESHNAAVLAENKRQYNTTQASKSSSGTIKKSSSGGSGGSGSGSKISKSSGSSGTSSGKVTKPTTTKTVKSTTAEPEIDQASVLLLGYGPLSGAELADKEKQGIITSYVKNGKRYFEKTNHLNINGNGKGYSGKIPTIAKIPTNRLNINWK